MNKIIFPLERGKQGREVGDLQDALQVLLERGVVGADDAARRELVLVLRRERAEQIYGGVTQKLLSRRAPVFAVPFTPVAIAMAGLGLASGTVIPDAE